MKRCWRLPDIQMLLSWLVSTVSAIHRPVAGIVACLGVVDRSCFVELHELSSSTTGY